jgi:DNA-directed RNA polymerase specialized sigma subunit
MTKATLQNHRALKREVRQLNRLLRSQEAVLASETETGRELLDYYREKRDRLIASQKRIEDAIDALPPIERTILRGRYIEGRSWTAICQEVHYSRTRTFEIHDAAVRKLARKA